MADHHHESCWIIEATYAPGPLYYAGHCKQRNGLLTMGMASDAAKAVRFPDEWGAKYALGAMLGVKDATDPTWPFVFVKWGYTVVEHIFDYTPSGVQEPIAGGARNAGVPPTPAPKRCDCAAHSAADCVCGAWTTRGVGASDGQTFSHTDTDAAQQGDKQ